MTEQTNTSGDEHDKKHCSCCGRYLVNAKHTTMKEQFCQKCGIVHLGNVLSNEPNEYFKQGYAKVLVDVEKFIQEHTYQRVGNNNLIRFLPFEWDDFKKQEIAKKESK